MGTASLAEGLAQCTSLSQLDLGHNLITAEGVLTKCCISLSAINLEHNQLGDDGVEYLAEGVKRCKVRCLYLQHTGIR